MLCYTVANMDTVSSLETPALGSITRASIPDQVAAIVKRFILVEGLAEGDLIPSERQLAKMLGVSHRAVREALGVLAGEGVIRKEHGRGTFVNKVDEDQLVSQLGLFELALPDVNGLHEARAAIERGIMPLVAQQATDGDLQAMEACIASMEKHADAGASILADDIDFHLALLRATHNEALQGLREIITASVRLYSVWRDPRGLGRGHQTAAHIIRAHRSILEAIRERDGDKAYQAVHTHLTWRHQTDVQRP
jgi:GntR family transcriptional repressor for pyruvate dehydrogenase complex